MSIGDWIARNTASLMALAAIGIVLLNLILAYIKYRSDGDEETSRRSEAQAKIVSTSLDLLSLLETRVGDLEKDNAKFKTLADKQAKQISEMQDQNDLLGAKLREIDADRKNLLQRVLTLQDEIARNKVLITRLLDALAAQHKTSAGNGEPGLAVSVGVPCGNMAL